MIFVCKPLLFFFPPDFAFDVLLPLNNSKYENNSLQSGSSFSPPPFSAELWHVELKTIFASVYMKTDTQSKHVLILSDP